WRRRWCCCGRAAASSGWRCAAIAVPAASEQVGATRYVRLTGQGRKQNSHKKAQKSQKKEETGPPAPGREVRLSLPSFFSCAFLCLFVAILLCVAFGRRLAISETLPDAGPGPSSPSAREAECRWRRNRGPGRPRR